MEITDRYKATGTPYPDPETMCRGQCDGMGYYPTRREGDDVDAWDKAHRFWRFRLIRAFLRKPCLWYLKEAFGKHDGWHFVKCRECNGTGKDNE